MGAATVVLGLDLQGGSYLLLEVDSNYVEGEARADARRRAQDPARSHGSATPGSTTRPTAWKSASRKATCRNALTKLRELSQPLGGLLGSSGQRSLEVSDAGGGLIRLAVPQAAITERVRQTIEQSIQIVERRVNQLGTVEPLIQRQGADRILVQVPGLQDPSRLKELLGKTAKMEFRMVDTTVPPDQAQQGRVPPDSEVLMSSTSPRYPTSSRSRCRVGRRFDRRAARLRSAFRRADRQLPLQHVRLAKIRAGDFGECRTTLCDRARQ